MFLKISQNSKEILCLGLFFKKIAGLGNRLWHRRFLVNFAKFSRTAFSCKLWEAFKNISFYRIPLVAAFEICSRESLVFRFFKICEKLFMVVCLIPNFLSFDLNFITDWTWRWMFPLQFSKFQKVFCWVLKES